MKTITETKNIYLFTELSEKAQQKAINNEYENFIYFAQEDFNIYIDELLTDNGLEGLEYQYSLFYSQGDGLNLYGDISFEIMLELLKDNYTKKEYKRLKFYIDNCSSTFKIPYNNRDSYCYARNIDFASDLIYELENLRNIDEKLIEQFERDIIKYFENLCRDLEKKGYDYFDTDNLLNELLENDYDYYYENGNSYGEI